MLRISRTSAFKELHTVRGGGTLPPKYWN